MSDIELKLDGLEEDDEKLDKILKSEVENVQNKVVFTEDEERLIDEFSKKIDLENTNIILQYGSGAQKKISNFSEKTLDAVKDKDLGEIGKLLDEVVMDIKTMDEEESKGPLGFLKKQGSKIEKLKIKYQSTEKNINEVARSLENHQITLMKDISMLDQMYDLNEDYYKEISMYIEAGKRKLNDLYNTELPALEKVASESNLPLDAQKVNDLKAQANRFEKKLHDLDLTRMVSIQMAPQIRMVQSSNSIMAEKIQTTITTTIPLWKNQMVLALGMHHTDQAIRTQKMVTDLTNELLKKNADNLKQNTIETARATERGIVDLETIKHTNEAIISTIEEVRNIQIEGAKNREKAQAEIRNLEEELKNKLTRRN
ncbi:toxic anion resistance protein [uncultured Anaerococcus sp.]|uniref:toxic anion resistance protein n=1 Tax=uncultured Anaerococcus sp. TaxID=293428 RepID=UPI0025D7C256|nr:toxic anion resistance protein [uncultured Anaerococcus sp.]